MYRIITLITLITVAFTSVSGQQKNAQAGNYTGHVHNYDPATKDSIMVAYYPDQSMDQVTELQFYVHPDRLGNFKFTIPPVSHPIKVLFSLNGSKRIFINDYLMEPGDNIHMEIFRNRDYITVEYSGKGAEKYTLTDLNMIQNDLYYKRNLSYELALQKTNLPDADIAKLQVQKHLKLHSLLKQATQVFHKNFKKMKMKLSPQIASLLKAELLSFYKGTWVTGSKFYLDSCKGVKYKQMIITNYNKYKLNVYANQSTAYSLNAIISQLQQIRFELYLENNRQSFSYTRLYQKIKNNYSGPFRERMLLYFFGDAMNFNFVNGYTQVEFGNCLSDALSYLRDPKVIALLRKKGLLKKGMPVYDFNLPDQQGKMYNLANFKDKVILIDFWGEGCTSCAHFSNIFEHEIYPKLKTDTNFKIVSVSTDRRKETWEQGLKSGWYTQKSYINLYTAGFGIKHPFLQYYGINTIPFLLLIDRKGHIFAELQANMPAQEVLETIKAALTE